MLNFSINYEAQIKTRIPQKLCKYIELKLNATDEETAREQVELICDQLLANPVIENYRFELNEVKI